MFQDQYMELSGVVNYNILRNITFTEVNNLMDSNSWVKLLEKNLK